MRTKLGNTLVLAVLRSPLHRLLSGVAVELRYAGRRSGREYVLPVQYARAGDRLVIRPQDPQASSWWRNFSAPRTVTVRLAGREHEATATTVERDDPAWADLRAVYAARWRRLAGPLTGPFVVIEL
jgi:deazaflavin-dependent oxidoreductase (nitroreductase family)